MVFLVDEETFIGVADYAVGLAVTFIPMPHLKVVDANFFDSSTLMIALQTGSYSSKIQFRDLDADPTCQETSLGNSTCIKCAPGFQISGATCNPAALGANCRDQPCSYCDNGYYFNVSVCVACT